MAFSAGIGDRAALKSPREDSAFASITSPLRSVAAHMSSANDARGHLHRRFTTNNIPTLNTPLSPIGQQRRQAAEPAELTTATFHKLQVLEKKKLEYEYLREQRRRFEAEMELIDLQTRRDEEEITRLSSDIRYGKHSQPTTPPEYSDSNGFPSALSRPNRFSMSSITPGAATPRGRSGSHITSPPSGPHAGPANHGNGFLPSHSVPGSRRGSDEDGDEYEHDDFAPMSPVARPNANRFSMPVTAQDVRGRNDLPDLASVLGHINTAAFLFDEDDAPNNPVASPGNNSYHVHMTSDDKFPILSMADDYDRGNTVETTPTKNMANNRRSVEYGGFSPYAGESKRSSFQASPSANMPKLQQSFSSNDVPTLKNGNVLNGTNGSGVNTHAEQHFHNHNANMGRVPANAMNNRHSRELSTGFKDNDNAYRSPQSALHGSAAPFGPTMSSPPNGAANAAAMAPFSTAGATAPYYGYGMNALNGAMNNMSLNGQVAAPPVYNPGNMYPGMQQHNLQQSFYNPYATFGPNGRVQDSQARVIQSRRMQNDANRFVNYDLKTMPRHEIYTLCKDQHGCRFLQKKLEERNPEHLDIIFEETAPHVVELMTDPFGNYLCQKLLEFTTDEQRDTLVRNATPSLVQIALNQHGTRALQKMIEFISTAEQIRMIIKAFTDQVVELIQDLNGNHVIQKCLNHLKSEDAQFIFDAVGHNCVIVGTHRHGCCVLQRCIDHASGFQKVQLVRQITANAFQLVQDPFGNYVVQYILDLNDASFTAPLCLGFAGKVAELSKQKFSSNVIEKCIRCADMGTKRVLVEELMDPESLETLMRDSFGNYVIQTALEFAPPDICIHLIDSMRPILPQIRQTPYGRRIQSKVQERESRLANYSGRVSGHATPHTMSTTQSPEMAPSFAGQIPGSTAFQPGMYSAVGNGYHGNIASPQPHRTSNPPLPSHLQNAVQYQGYGQPQPPNNMGNFF